MNSENPILNWLIQYLLLFVSCGFVSSGISFLMQNHFLKKQQEIFDEKQKKDEIKKFKFLTSAFILESKYNMQLIEKGSHDCLYALFDTQSYSIFKENLSLFDDETLDRINKVYFKLFETNKIIELNQEQGKDATLYIKQLKPLLVDFIDYFKNKISKVEIN